MFDFRRLSSIEKPWRWNELVTLSAKYRDLSSNAQLALTVGYSLLLNLIERRNGYQEESLRLGFSRVSTLGI